MGIAASNKVCHCFSCGVSLNIFQAAHFLENKPITGIEFIQENLLYLANKFGIEVEMDALTEEQAYEYDTYRAYRAAADLVTNHEQSEIYKTEVNTRNWRESTLREYRVGCVPDYKRFRDALKSVGFSASFLDDIDLGRREIFGEDRLIFTICDPKGRPVGFASRNLSYTDDRQNGAKYVNQRGTGVKCNIYKKSTRLFGLDVALKHRESPTESIYIFEGYPDVVSAGEHGLYNTCAVGSATITLEQLHVLKDSGYYNIILCFDGDQAGQTRTSDMLDTILNNQKDLSVSVVMIPDGQDPDDFIRARGIDEFCKLKKWSAFEWRLAQFSEDATPESICAAMLPLVVNESSYIVQEKHCEVLSKATGVTIRALQQELERLQNLKSRERVRDRQHVIDKLTHDLSLNPDEAEYAIQAAESALFEVAKRYDEDIFSEASCLEELDAQKLSEEEKDGTFSGFRLGPDLSNLERALNGQWRRGVWLCLGGKPNTGKTSFLSKFAFSLASIAENDACVIYHSIDDTIEMLRPKFISAAEGSRKLTLNQVLDPQYFVQSTKDQSILKRRNVGYSILRDLIKEGRLIMKDATHGSSLAFADRLIRYYKTKYPTRNIIYILDNFHKLQDFRNAKGDERTRFKELSTVVKDMAVQHGICIITTVEYKKVETGKKATNSDLAETGQIEYDANLVAHVHNELHDLRNKAKLYHTELVDGDFVPCPTIEVEISKNKITGYKGSLWYDFYPHCSDFVGVHEQEILRRNGETNDDDDAVESQVHLV
jgi:DNA primase catalytic core